MSKKILLILGGIIAVLGVLFYFLYTNSKNKIVVSKIAPISEYPPFNIASTKLSFDPNPAYINSDGTIMSEIVINTEENRLTGLQLELAYDPKVLKFVSIKPVDILHQRKIFANRIDENAGRITFGAGVSAEFSVPIIGSSEELVEVVFRPIDVSAGQTQIKFLPETHVSAEGINGSALIGTQDLTVEL